MRESRHSEPAALPEPLTPPDGRRRQRALWLFIGVCVIAIGVALTSLVRTLQADQALREVARGAAAPAAVPTTASPPAVRPPPAAPTESDSGAAVQSVLPPPAAGTLSSNESGGQPEGSASDSAARPEETSGEAKHVRTNAQHERAKAQHERVRPSQRKAPAATAEKPMKRPVPEGRGTRAAETFRRCPPLGKEGAVLCRWHICNGAAGKERACRPYLERQP